MVDVIRLPENCDQQCETTLISVNNTYIALGKEMPRVKPVRINPASFDYSTNGSNTFQ